MPATGARVRGLPSAGLDSEANVVVYIILSEARLLTLLPGIDEFIRAGYRVKAMVSDISILPRKGDSEA